jgi:hypothetical protein
MLRNRVLGALILAALVALVAGCGKDEYKPKTEGDTQTKFIMPGKNLAVPDPGAPAGGAK